MGKAVTELGRELQRRFDQARYDLRHGFRPAQVEATLRAIAAEARAGGEERVLADAELELATTARYQKRLEEARALATSALARYQTPLGRAYAHLELAKIDLDTAKDPGEHLDLARHALLGVSTEIEARIEYVRARACLRQGAFAESRELLQRALWLLEDREHCDYYRARYLAQLGFVERLRGAGIAQEHLLAAHERADTGGFRRVKAYCLLDLGQIALRRKDLELARGRLMAAAGLFVTVADELGEAHALSALGAVWRLRGELEKAVESIERALAIYAALDHLPGAALAHRRLAQTYIELLDRQRQSEEPLSKASYEAAVAECDLALTQFKELDNIDGQAGALATQGRLLYVTDGPAAALVPAMAAVELLGEVRGQFRQGLERLEFGRLHGWIFGFAMLCATESKNADKALRVATIVWAETLGGAARYTLRGVPGELGDMLRAGFEHEQGLRPSASDAVPLTISPQDMRERRNRFTAALNEGLARALAPPLERARPPAGCYRLSVQLFNGDDLYVVCEGPAEADADVKRVPLSEEDRGRIGAVARAEADAIWDARPRRWEQLGQLVLPEGLGQLRSRLLAGEVKILEIQPARDLVSMPFGSLLIEGRPLDELTAVLLSPSNLPSWLWRAQEDSATGSRRPSRREGDGGAPASSPAKPTSFGDVVEAVLFARDAEVHSGGGDRTWSTIELMEIASGQPTLKRLFASDADVASHFYMACERYRQDGLGWLEAVRAAKASHRRGCGAACPPAHVGAFVVAGRLAYLVAEHGAPQ